MQSIEMNEIILKLERVVKTYKTRTGFLGGAGQRVIALDEVNLEISKGEIFGLVGESGSGKTTAGRLIVGLEEPDRGKIILDGEDVTRLKGRTRKDFRRRVQMIFQDPYQSLNPQLSLFDTVSEPLIIHHMGRYQEREEKVARAFTSVGLSPPENYFYRYPHQLSGGQRQRVAIARAMVLNPGFVVADEPTSMLDASYSAKIFNILTDMRDSFHVTLLFITHSLAAACYLCDRLAVVYKGYLVEVGGAQDVIRNPKHPYTQALLDALPKFGHCEGVRRYDSLLKERRKGSGREGCPFFLRCKFGDVEKCTAEKPLFKTVGDRHLAACFFAEPGDEDGPEAQACSYGI